MTELQPYLSRYQIKQHTPEWYEKRETLITASKAANYLECSQYGFSSNSQFQNNQATLFGTHHEEIARKAIESRYNIEIKELGLAIHKDHGWLAASPDGICVLTKDKFNSLDKLSKPNKPEGPNGPDKIICLVEIKCPYNRQIDNKIPFEYWIQMQIQMEVWDVDYVLYNENEFSRNPGNEAAKINETNETNETNEKQTLGTKETKETKEKGKGKGKGKGTIQTGELLKNWDVIVYRDRAWFNRILYILQQNKQRLTQDKRIFWDHSHNPNQIRNWITGDTIIDWLEKYHTLDPAAYEKDPRKKYDLARFASKQTLLFHNEILAYLDKTNIQVSNIAKDWYDQVRPNSQAELVKEPNIYKSYAKNALTLKAIKIGVPVIADAILLNEENQRWGKADLLVRDDYLDTLFTLHPDELNKHNSKNSNNKNNKNNKNKKGGYKYYVVLTRFASLKLTADGIHLLNDPKQKMYKGFISFLTECLPRDVRSDMGFIIGRKASWISKGVSYRKDGFSVSLGQISLSDKDQHVPQLVDESIKWLKLLDQEGANWRPEGQLDSSITATGIAATSATLAETSDKRESKKTNKRKRDEQETTDDKTTKKRPVELCPNMKNKHDHPWHNVKKRIAKQTKEITEILNIGPEKRNRMIREGGIHTWDQISEEDLTTYQISDKTCVNNILRANKESVLIGFDEVKKLTPDEEDIECYVDFETVTDLNETIGDELFDTSPGIGGQSNIIYMIGCYVHYRNNSEKDEYLNYLIKTINPENEKEILTNWMKDLNKILGKSRRNAMIPIYHWSPAEVTQLKRVKSAYVELSDFIDRMNFIDLYQIFKQSKVGIPGAFGYGLKTVAKALHSLGKIKDTWEENLNGADAMVAAWYLNNANIMKLDQPEGVLSETDKLAKEIIIYNYYDCKVMEEIVEYVRQNDFI